MKTPLTCFNFASARFAPSRPSLLPPAWWQLVILGLSLALLASCGSPNPPTTAVPATSSSQEKPTTSSPADTLQPPDSLHLARMSTLEKQLRGLPSQAERDVELASGPRRKPDSLHTIVDCYNDFNQYHNYYPRNEISEATIVDTTNGYIRWTAGKEIITEAALWRTPTGRIILGLTYPGGVVPMPASGDASRERNETHFYFVHEDTEDTVAFYITPPEVQRVVQKKVKFYTGYTYYKLAYETDGNSQRMLVYHFPRRGTTIRVGLDSDTFTDYDDDAQELPEPTSFVKPQFRHQDITLCYLKWQQGRFVASLVP